MLRKLSKGVCIATTGVAAYSVVNKRLPTLSVAQCFSTSNHLSDLLRSNDQYISEISNGAKTSVVEKGRHIATLPTQEHSQNITIRSPLNRESTINTLASQEFDLLIIGGGVVGAATAVEATSRGLKVALVDKGDFASGTSSRSTKLIHGGVRYLEQAFTGLDYSMLELVQEALHERGHMINSCGYMNKPLPILIPITSWWEIPYMWMGVKMYEAFAGKSNNVPSSYFLNREQSLKKFPTLAADKLGLTGSIVYFDGQMNDARHTLTLALTSEEQGASIANYVQVLELTHDASNPANKRVNGAKVVDLESQQTFSIRAKAVVNACGPFADQIRKMDDKTAQDLIVPSAGVHITIPDRFCSPDMGMLVPKTSDGRLLFVLPWEGGVIAGTTDAKSDICDMPLPAENDVKFILEILNDYLNKPVTVDDVDSIWAGLRPLVRDPNVEGTSKLSRNHVVLTSVSGLVSVMGGKYTTHRQMAQDALDAVIKAQPNNSFNIDEKVLTTSVTSNVPIHGAVESGEVCDGNYDILKSILRSSYGLSQENAQYLTRNYGTRAIHIAAKAVEDSQKERRSNVNDSLNNAEIDYSVDFECARHAEDILIRRTRLGFINSQKAMDHVNTVVDRMARKFGWSKAKCEEEKTKALSTLEKMSYNYLKKSASDNNKK